MKRTSAFRISMVLVILTLLATSLFITSSANAQEPEEYFSYSLTIDQPAPTNTILDIITNDSQFSKLSVMLQVAEMDTQLTENGPFTFFAPTDKAFEKLPAGASCSLLKNIPQLKEVLQYHLVENKLSPDDLAKTTEIDTLLIDDSTEEPLHLNIYCANGKIKLNNTEFNIMSIEADNGIIYVIDIIQAPATVTGINLTPVSDANSAVKSGST